MITHQRATGTHDGELMGAAPTGKPIGVRAVNIERLADGEIVARASLIDTMALPTQIDALPADLSEALDFLEKDAVIKNALGEHIHENFVRAKRQEKGILFGSLLGATLVIALLVAAVVFEAAPAPAVAAEPDFVVEVFPHPDPETRFSDTWGAARSGGRRHEGVDMLAPTGTPIFAVVSGSVRFSQNRLGGNAVSLVGDNGNRYYYAHLSRYEGSSRRVSQGELIGCCPAATRRSLTS